QQIPEVLDYHPALEPDAPQAFNWEAVLFDGEQEYQWSSDGAALLRLHLAERYGTGFSGDPYLTNPGQRSGHHHIAQPPFDIMFLPGFSTGYKFFLNYAKTGKHHPSYKISFNDSEGENFVTINSFILPWTDDYA